MSGKGDKYRPTKLDKYGKNYDDIFRKEEKPKPPPPPEKPKQP